MIIVLEKCWGMRPDRGDKSKMVNTYLGKIVVDSEDFTPERIADLKDDKQDKQGWKKYRKKLKKHGINIE